MRSSKRLAGTVLSCATLVACETQTLNSVGSVVPTLVGVAPGSDGAAVTIPGADLELEIHGRLSLFIQTGTDLSQLTACKRAWKDELDHVANAVLPFDSLIIHTGDRDLCATTFGGAYVRVYVVDDPVSDLSKKIPTRASEAIAALPNARTRWRVAFSDTPTDPARERWSPRTSFPGWTYVPVGYALGFEDYGGQLDMDYFLRRIGSRTLVLLFAHSSSVVHEVDGVRVDPIAATVLSLRMTLPDGPPASAEVEEARIQGKAYVEAMCACTDYECYARVRQRYDLEKVDNLSHGRARVCVAQIDRQVQTAGDATP